MFDYIFDFTSHLLVVMMVASLKVKDAGFACKVTSWAVMRFTCKGHVMCRAPGWDWIMKHAEQLKSNRNLPHDSLPWFMSKHGSLNVTYSILLQPWIPPVFDHLKGWCSHQHLSAGEATPQMSAGVSLLLLGLQRGKEWIFPLVKWWYQYLPPKR